MTSEGTSSNTTSLISLREWPLTNLLGTIANLDSKAVDLDKWHAPRGYHPAQLLRRAPISFLTRSAGELLNRDWQGTSRRLASGFNCASCVTGMRSEIVRGELKVWKYHKLGLRPIRVLAWVFAHAEIPLRFFDEAGAGAGRMAVSEERRAREPASAPPDQKEPARG